jgi:hypothetical protein
VFTFHEPTIANRDAMAVNGRDRAVTRYRFARKATYISAIAFSALIWATAEGFGGP